MKRNTLKLIIKMSVPPALSMLIQCLYNLVDSIYITQFDPLAMEAISLVYPLQNIILAIGLGIGIGINAYASNKMGQGDQASANNGATLGVIASIINYILVVIIGLFTTRIFVESFTSNAQVIEYALTYINLIIVFSFTTIVQIALEKILQANGTMMLPMISLIIGSVINIALDPLLIFNANLGILGASIATVVGQVIATLIMLYFVLSKRNKIRLDFKHLKLDMTCLKKIYLVGVPSIILTAIPSIMVGAMNYILITLNSLAVTTFGIYYKLQYFVYMAVSGISQGTMPLISYSVGAKDDARFKSIVDNSIFLALGIGIFSMLIFLVLPGPIMSLFYDETLNTTAVQNLMRVASLSFGFGSINYFLASYFQSVQEGFKSLMVAVLRQFVLILPTAFALSLVLDEMGVYLAIPISEALTLFITLIFFSKDFKKKINKMKELKTVESI